MKKINLLKTEPLNTKNIIETIIANAPSGTNLEEIRKRHRIFEALEKIKAKDNALKLEDADYEFLKGLTVGFRFLVYTPDLKNILEGIVSAEDVKGE